MKNKTFRLQVALGVAIFMVCIAFLTLTRSGHILNGDYALYICQAQKLLSGEQWQVYQDMGRMLQLSTEQHYSPILYPWGMPLLLTLPYLLFGINYGVFKLILAGCIITTLFILYKDFVFRKELHIGMWALLLLGMNATIVLHTDRILSTLPYMLCLMVSLTLIHRLSFTGTTPIKAQQKIAVGVGIGLFLTVQMRTEGLLLLPALLLHQFIHRKNVIADCSAKARWLTALLPYAVFLLLFLLTLPYLPVGYLIHAAHPQESTFSLSENIGYYLMASPQSCLPFLPSDNIWTTSVFWFSVLTGIWSTDRRQSIADLTYLTLHFLLLVIWPHQTERYLIPIIPILLYFMTAGIYKICHFCSDERNRVAEGVLLFGVSCQFMNWSIQMYSTSDTYSPINIDVTAKNAQETFDYLNRHTQPTDIIACGESRTIYLYTGRLSCNLSYSVTDTAQKADWYVLFKNRHNYLQHEPDVLYNRPDIFKSVYANEDLIVYKILQP